jgi:hypothetical protein
MGQQLKSQGGQVAPKPPEGVQANRWIEIDLFQQTIMAYEDGQLRFATVTTTGVEPFYTNRVSSPSTRKSLGDDARRL